MTSDRKESGGGTAKTVMIPFGKNYSSPPFVFGENSRVDLFESMLKVLS
jgi:hypothetical protein